jgi:GNAT superfamily N-acetyltransferase
MRRGPNVATIEITVRPARPPEGERLREIAIASKSTWGYDLDRVRQWAALGDFSDEGLRKKEFYVADAAGEAVGWAALIPKGEVCWLDDLWIDPAWMGRGLGTLLFQHAVARGRQVGAVRLEWEAERHSVGFYEKMGGRYLRDSEPGVWGRVNAVMSIDLS